MPTHDAIIETLRNAPAIIRSMVREAPAELLKQRPPSGKWSIHEHAIHLTRVHPVFFQRLDLMLTDHNPAITPYEPPADEQAGSLLEADLDQALDRYQTERSQLTDRLRSLGAGDWGRPAQHPEYKRYTIEIMFRHLALHDAYHGYRIEELLLGNQ